MNDNAGISKHFIKPFKSSFIHSDETEVLNNDRNAHCYGMFLPFLMAFVNPDATEISCQ